MFEDFDHVGIAVAALDPALDEYRERFGMEVIRRERSDAHAIEIAMVGAGTGQVELLAPLTEDSDIGRFVASHGPGLHHLAYRVPDIEAALAQLRERGVPMIDEQPRTGFAGSKIAFVALSATDGVLTEIVEPAA
jgi:methylmalonyl-CoA epimerase